MSSVIEFPGKEPPPEGYSEKHVDKVHAEAFRDLEGEVCDLDRMGQIAQDLIMNCVASKESFHDLELASFAVSQLAKMAKEFRANYEKRWYGARVGVS
jgi:hypothetical protein